jgi:uncharacterized phiE125 gp8 family phage protein
MSYGIKVITPSTDLPIALADAKLHLKLDSDTTDDTLVTTLISVAQEIVENYCRIRLLPTIEELYIDQFPFEYQIQLSKWPINSITYCHYLDPNGTETTLDPTCYIADTVSKPGRLCLNYARFWPVSMWIDNAVWIRYSVGFANVAAIPATLRQAMLLLIGHLYENRQEVVTNTHVENIPNGAKWLMNMNRYLRL